MPRNGAAHCARCGGLLYRRPRGTLTVALVSAVCAAAMFPFALALPMVDLREAGRFSRSTLFTGPNVLRHEGMPLLSAVLLVLLVFVPATKIALQLFVLVARQKPQPPNWTPRAFQFARRLGPYAMPDVFLLGFFVAYARLAVIAHVDIRPALVAVAGLMIAMAAVDASLDPREVHDASNRGAAPGARKMHSISNTWALVVAGLLLYVPANTLPMMYVEHLGRTDRSTIFGGVQALLDAGAWPLAALVFVASIVVPLLKLLALATMLSMTHLRVTHGLRAATRLHRWVDVIGRWSLLDMFALTTLVGLVRMGKLAAVMPGEAAPPFCAVALLTMLATETFDTRLMWDAAAAAQTEGSSP